MNNITSTDIRARLAAAARQREGIQHSLAALQTQLDSQTNAIALFEHGLALQLADEQTATPTPTPFTSGDMRARIAAAQQQRTATVEAIAQQQARLAPHDETLALLQRLLDLQLAAEPATPPAP